jgi:DNA-binding response OmpR family regulator
VQRVLLIDDDPSVHEVVRAYLERENYLVFSAITGTDGLDLVRFKDPSLVILDLLLPDIRGSEVCARIREESDVPILMLTASGGTEERIAGFAIGADDYLPKPYSPRELVARVRALLRRAGRGDGSARRVMRFDGGDLVIDGVRHEVTAHGRPVPLTPSEHRLLAGLAEYPGRAYSRMELINRLQGHDFAGYERTIDAHVKNLRRKLELDPSRPRFVQTVRGVGYRLGATPG